MVMNAGFSLKEAAVLADVSEKTIRHELARDIATPGRRRVGRAVRRRLDVNDIFYLQLVAELPVSLAVEDRRNLYAMVARRLRSKGRWRRAGDRLKLIGAVAVEIDASDLRLRLAERLRLYRRGLGRVVSRPDVIGGEPVFEGTRIPIRHVGQLARRGIPELEILDDYPSLTSEDVAFARLYVELPPDPGRPRKPLELRHGS